MDGQEQDTGEQELFRRTISLNGKEIEFVRVARLASRPFSKLRVVLFGELSLELLMGTRLVLGGDIGMCVTPINWDCANGCICLEVSDAKRAHAVSFTIYRESVKASELERLDTLGNYLGCWEQDALPRDAASRVRSQREDNEREIAKAFLRLRG